MLLSHIMSLTLSIFHYTRTLMDLYNDTALIPDNTDNLSNLNQQIKVNPIPSAKLLSLSMKQHIRSM